MNQIRLIELFTENGIEVKDNIIVINGRKININNIVDLKEDEEVFILFMNYGNVKNISNRIGKIIIDKREKDKFEIVTIEDMSINKALIKNLIDYDIIPAIEFKIENEVLVMSVEGKPFVVVARLEVITSVEIEDSAVAVYCYNNNNTEITSY